MVNNEIASTFFNQLDEELPIFKELEEYSINKLRQVYVLNSPLGIIILIMTMRKHI